MSRDMRVAVQVLFLAMFLCACDRDKREVDVSTISMAEVSSDCAFWLEGGAGKLRAGVAGACEQLSMQDYARALQQAIGRVAEADKARINAIYLNMHDGSQPMARMLVDAANASVAWNGSCEHDQESVCFEKLNAETRFMAPLEAVIAMHFGNARFKLTFLGGRCSEAAAIERSLGINPSFLSKPCYPTTFGVAVFGLTR